MNISRKSLISIAIALVLIFILVGIAGIEIDRGLVRKKIALVKLDMQNLDNALESYTIDYNVYPAPDTDSEGNLVVSKRLISVYTRKPFIRIGSAHVTFSSVKPYTTPSYINKLPYDPFNHHGKGLYHYAPDKYQGGFWNNNAFIISSYGPDEVNGYGTTKFNLEHFVYDSERSHPDWVDKDSIAPYPLKISPFTYDPTNGLISGGDIWRRGP